MSDTDFGLWSMTAGDVMTRDVKSIPADLPLPDAARRLAAWGVRGAPVVDEDGRCVGVLSVSDLSRWAGARGAGVPRTCSFQAVDRAPGGHESVLCLLGEGVCPFQRRGETADGRACVTCTEPHCVPTDWQVVQLAAAPAVARDAMSTTVVGVGEDADLPGVARVMLDCGVLRVLVFDAAGRPVGVVAVADLLQVMAHPELLPAGSTP